MSVPFLWSLPPTSHPVPLFWVASLWSLVPVSEFYEKGLFTCYFVSHFFFAAHYVFEIHLLSRVPCDLCRVILMSMPPFIRSVVDGRVDCFQLWFITGDTALTILCSVCAWVYGGIKWEGILGFLGMHTSNFSRYCQIKFQRRSTGRRILGQFELFHFLTQTRIIRTLFFLLWWMWWFYFVFPVVNEVESLLISLLPFGYPLLSGAKSFDDYFIKLDRLSFS